MNKNRDARIVAKIIGYCNKIEGIVSNYNVTLEMIKNDTLSLHKDAITMSLLQIGELANGLSEELKIQYKDMQWHKIRGMRNVIAHGYETFDVEILWEVITDNIPVLMQECTKILKELEN